jgi:hypothetical protein
MESTNVCFHSTAGEKLQLTVTIWISYIRAPK